MSYQGSCPQCFMKRPQLRRMHVYKPHMFIFPVCIVKKCNDDDNIII